MRHTVNCSMILIIALLIHFVVSSSAEPQPDDVTGMLATVMHQLEVVTENQAETNQKLDETITAMTELQQTVARLTERVSAVEEVTASEVSCCCCGTETLRNLCHAHSCHNIPQ